MIRPLDPLADRTMVHDLFQRSADYVRLERDADPSDACVEEYFTESPPGTDPARSLRLGIFGPDGRLAGIADCAFGYPEASDAYLGLMQFAVDARGGGLGAALLAHVEAAARDRGARWLYLAVLHANPRGRAFWERHGFTLAAADREVTLGGKTQLADRLVKAL